MSAPTVTSIRPARGLSIGKTLVEVLGSGFALPSAGGGVAVLFGGVAARRVQVVSPARLLCLTPGGSPDAPPVDVTVRNLLAPSTPDGEVVVPAAFAYARPDLSSPEDLSNHPLIVLITRTLVAELQRTVIREAAHDAHPEYASPESALVPEEKRATSPNLKVTGPRLVEDGFYRVSRRVSVEGPPGTFTEFAVSPALDLEYGFVGVARTSAEAGSLHAAMARYLRDTLRLAVAVPSAGEVHAFELAPVWGDRGDFKGRATRQGIYQFSGSIVVRGVRILGNDPVGISVKTQGLSVKYLQKGP